MNKYYFLAVFLGIICKINDDLVDNDLFGYFNLNKEYTSEILKIISTISATTLSLKYPLVWVMFASISIHSLLVPRDYEIFEKAGFISLNILIPFLNFASINIYELGIILWVWFYAYVSEVSSNMINEEFSIKKIVLEV